MRSNKKKVTSRTTVFLIILSLLLVFTSLPVYGTNDSGHSTTPEQNLDSPTEDIFVIAEDTTKRSEFEKHYYCSDGSFVAVTYPEAVHYQDDDGTWVDVDNRPAINNTENTYEMVNGDFKVSFPDYAPESNGNDSTLTNSASPQDRLISIETGNYVLSWSLTAHKPMSTPNNMSMTATSEVSLQSLSVSPASDLYAISDFKSVSATETSGFKEQVNIKDKTVFDLPRASGKVAVSNIFGVDEPVSVEYTVYRNKVEEDIYIHAPTDIEAYSMVVNCGDLTPRLNDDHSVDFINDNGEMIYHVSIPYMVDAVYESTQSIEVSLLHKGSQCVISYTPDQEWLNDEARVYPVLLDPSVTTNEYNGSIYDSYVEENTTTNHSSEQAMYITKNGNNRRKALIFIHKLPSIDPSVPITSATLTLKTSGYVSTDVPVKLESFDSTLFIDYMSYSLLQSYNKTTVATDTLEAYSSEKPLNWNARQVSFDLTDYMSTMYQQLSSTYGCRFALSLQNEDSTLLFPAIHSSESTDVSLRPCLTITYGYTIPEYLKNDCIITLYNGSSVGYLYPHSGLLGDNNNILHYNGVAADSPTIQYILSRNPATGGYTLTHASAPVLGAKVTADTSTKRVYLHTDDDPSKQEWLLVPHIVGYRIVLRSDMQYALTAVGSPSGYNDDQTITTDGHVILKKHMGNMEFNMTWHVGTKIDYWGDVISLGWHITGNKCEVVFTVKETTTFNIETYSTNQTGDHATVTSLYTHGTSTLISDSTSLGDLTTGNINYAVPVNQSEIERSSISNVQLTKGIPYKLVVEQYESTAPLDFYLIISQTNYTNYYFYCENYSIFTVDNQYEPVSGGVNCLGYAVVEYYKHITGLEMTYITGGLPPAGQEAHKYISDNYFKCKKQDYYSQNCIIAYKDSSNRYQHFAVSINGTITARLGTGFPYVKHRTYAYNNYDSDSITFIVLDES